MSSHVMGTESSGVEWVRNAKGDSTEVFQMFVDHQYLPTVQIDLLAGRNFTDDQSSITSVIVNEQFLDKFKLNRHDAIGEVVTLADGNTVTIIGVVKNFHYLDLRSPIQSFFFRYNPREWNIANVTLTSDDIFNDVSELEATWNELANAVNTLATKKDQLANIPTNSTENI